MQITIATTGELIAFINRKDITPIKATEIVCKALNVICLFELTKKELIEQTKYCIDTFFQNDSDCKPIFLGQKSKVVSIKDVYCSIE